MADFGLARDMQDDLYYRMNSELRLPVKWTAPESIRHQKFTTDSDIVSASCSSIRRQYWPLLLLLATYHYSQ